MIRLLRVIGVIAFLLMASMLLVSFTSTNDSFFMAWPLFGIWGTLSFAAAAIIERMDRKP